MKFAKRTFRNGIIEVASNGSKMNRCQKEFYLCVTIPCWNKALWLDGTSPVTISNDRIVLCYAKIWLWHRVQVNKKGMDLLLKEIIGTSRIEIYLFLKCQNQGLCKWQLTTKPNLIFHRHHQNGWHDIGRFHRHQNQWSRCNNCPFLFIDTEVISSSNSILDNIFS